MVVASRSRWPPPFQLPLVVAKDVRQPSHGAMNTRPAPGRWWMVDGGYVSILLMGYPPRKLTAKAPENGYVGIRFFFVLGWPSFAGAMLVLGWICIHM